MTMILMIVVTNYQCRSCILLVLEPSEALQQLEAGCMHTLLALARESGLGFRDSQKLLWRLQA